MIDIEKNLIKHIYQRDKYNQTITLKIFIHLGHTYVRVLKRCILLQNKAISSASHLFLNSIICHSFFILILTAQF
ncbi:hypothetical protein HMPREF3091_17590 [Hafnia sp. HMSC23F03]|nr:hypothetical protein HMPREF3091_17590 [Hafnia sp. HMSC23F03]